jgi:hypothetical protein
MCRRKIPEAIGVRKTVVRGRRCGRHGRGCRAVALRSGRHRLPRPAPHLHPDPRARASRSAMVGRAGRFRP